MANQDHPFVFEDGDVRAKATYNGQKITFKLCSYALCFASPVWKKFVFPPFPLLRSTNAAVDSQSKKSRTASIDPFPDIELDFTEDDPAALLVLLRITHLKFSTIASYLPYDTLYNFAVLCDQYDCRKLVGPLVNVWLKHEWDDVNLHQGGWLWIAYYFGAKSLFADLLEVLTCQAVPGDKGDCLIRRPHWYPNSHCAMDGTMINTYSLEKEGYPLPPKISETLLRIRTDVISLLLSNMMDFMDLLSGDENSVNCKETCNSAMLGLIVRKLNSHLFWPIPEAEDVGFSASELHASITFLLKEAHKAHQTIKIPHKGTPCRLYLSSMLNLVHGGETCNTQLPVVYGSSSFGDSLKIYNANLDRATRDVGEIDDWNE
ncbi:hypothetical protein SBOR_9714 [Sclerotinia borealis F-4128]|uniref:BTB domain-containing protein n=1 Tax=Sclerotinia borealis (strain F-4128) TaxID=1432307 RepID=W9BZB0_SCLBF|nr:hypothetical protein SBOR_9714 [Sclerotinia borealis F-4128]